MKKLTCLTLLLISLTIAFPTYAETASGSAIIPPFATNSQQGGRLRLFVSNITDNAVDVIISFHQTSGSVIKDDGSASTGAIKGGNYASGYSDNLTNGSVAMTIAAKSTAYVDLSSTSWNPCYGRIEWFQSSSTSAQALIASGQEQWSLPGGEIVFGYSISINNGLPF